MILKGITIILLLGLSLFSCSGIDSQSPNSISADFTQNRLSDIQRSLTNPLDSTVLVVAHRADWRNAPENSIEAIQSAISLGVDIVELDVRLTKDSVLVLMHDKTIDRTTNGSGKLSEWTYDSLQTRNLLNGQGRVTRFKIPRLREALLTAKGNILVNLDKCYEHFALVLNELLETNTLDHVIIKAYDKPYHQVRSELGPILEQIYFMPILRLDNIPNAKEEITLYQMEANPVAFELTFRTDTFAILSNLEEIKVNGSRVWINSLWDDLNGGHSDDLALSNPDEVYGWMIEKGANIIQTDRPQLLIKYLQEKGLHR